MEIPVYSTLGMENALSEGEFEIEGFRRFIGEAISSQQYDNDQQLEIFQQVLRDGTENLSPEEFLALHAFISRFNDTCQRCGNDFTWDEMDALNQAVCCSSCRNDLEAMQ